MPWKSKAQARWGHSASGSKALGGKTAVSEWDAATPKGSLPEKKKHVIPRPTLDEDVRKKPDEEEEDEQPVLSGRAAKRAEKKARRKFRHEISKRMWKVAARRIGMFARPAQLHAEARILTDRYMHAVDHAPTQVKPIEEVAPQVNG